MFIVNVMIVNPCLLRTYSVLVLNMTNYPEGAE
jgi:hypothetical protein